MTSLKNIDFLDAKVLNNSLKDLWCKNLLKASVYDLKLISSTSNVYACELFKINDFLEMSWWLHLLAKRTYRIAICLKDWSIIKSQVIISWPDLNLKEKKKWVCWFYSFCIKFSVENEPKVKIISLKSIKSFIWFYESSNLLNPQIQKKNNHWKASSKQMRFIVKNFDYKSESKAKVK